MSGPVEGALEEALTQLATYLPAGGAAGHAYAIKALERVRLIAAARSGHDGLLRERFEDALFALIDDDRKAVTAIIGDDRALRDKLIDWSADSARAMLARALSPEA